MANLNINEVFNERASLKIEPEEASEDRAARIKRENRNHSFDLFKNYILFVLIVIAFVVIAGGCVYETFLNASASTDKQRWAQTVLSSLFTGLVSFFIGQMTAKR